MASPAHRFHAVAFVENFSLRTLAPSFPGAKVTSHELHLKLGEGDAEIFVYPFGAVVFHDVNEERRARELQRIETAIPGATHKVVKEEFTVRSDAATTDVRVEEGMLVVDRLTPARAAIVALTVAQSAAMEYYEGIVDRLFLRTAEIVEPLEKHGNVPMRVRRLHRFIGEAIGTRTEVLSVLHLLDKPDAAWDDPQMDHIYDDLRAEFDLVDRYSALESKLRSVQDSLELVLDVARDRRLVLLEAAIVGLIVFEILLTLFRYH